MTAKFNWEAEAARIRKISEQFDAMRTRLLRTAPTLDKADEIMQGWDSVLEDWRTKLLELAWEMENRVDYRKANEHRRSLLSEYRASRTGIDEKRASI